MKKQWLIGIATVAMVATLTCGIVACAPNEEDVAIAQHAIEIVRDAYIDDPVETSGTYKVMGTVMVDNVSYNVNWSVSSEYQGYENYVSVGTINEDLEVPINVTLGSDVIAYKLTASVTVGSATESYTFDHVIPRFYTPSQAIALGDTVAGDDYYNEDGTYVSITVCGYVTSFSWDSSKSQYKIYIGDSKTTSYGDSFYVFDPETDDTYLLANGASTWEKGWYATFTGYLQNYSGTYELTYCNKTPKTGDGEAHCVALDMTPLTDADKVARASAALSVQPSLYTAAATQALTASLEGATVSWALKGTSTYANITENKTLNVTSVPEEGQETITLVATISCGSANDTKEIPVRLGQLSTTHSGSSAEEALTVAELQELASTLASGGYYGGTSSSNATKFYVKAYVTSGANSYSKQYKNWSIYIADTANTAKKSSFYVYRLAVDKTYLTSGDDLQVGDIVTLHGAIQNFNGTPQLISSTCVGHDKAGMTDEQKAQWVLDNLDLPSEAGPSDIEISTTSTLSGVTLSYQSNNDGAIHVDEENGKLVVKRSKTDDVTVIITVTATCGSAHPTKQFTIVVTKVPAIEDGDYVFDFSANTENSSTEIGDSDEQSHPAVCEFLNSMLKNGNGIELISDVTKASKVYKGQGDTSNGNYPSGTNMIKMGTSSAAGDLALTFEKKVSKVVIDCEQWKGRTTDTIVVNGISYTIPAEKAHAELTFEFLPTETVTITSNNRVLIYKITVTVDSTDWTDDVKIGKAKAYLEATGTIATEYEKLGSYDLPTSYLGATIDWSGEDLPASGVTVANGKLNITWLPETETQIKLKAHITCGSGTAQDVTIDANLAEAPAVTEEGTQDKPYSVADALAIAGILQSGGVFKDSAGTAKQVYVKGYVIAIEGNVGDWDSTNNYFTNVYIVDAAHKSETEKTNAIQVYKLALGDHLILKGDLAVGAEITVYGFIKNFNGVLEIADNDTTKVSATAYTDPRDADAKAEAAIANAKAAIGTEAPVKVATITLPQSDVTGVTLAYSGDERISGNSLTVTLGEEEIKVTITITATCSGTSSEHTGTITDFTFPAKPLYQVRLTGGILKNLLSYPGDNGGYPSDKSEYTSTVDDITFKHTGLGVYSDRLQWRYNNSTSGTSAIWNTTALQSITKVVFTWGGTTTAVKTNTNYLKVEFSTEATFPVDASKTETLYTNFSTDTNQATVTPSKSGYTYVRITHNNKGATYTTAIDIY